MSLYHKADPGELIQWVTHESRSSAALANSGLIRTGTQPRTADAWHHDSCRPRGVVTRDFSALFDRLFDRLPVRISTSDLHHWILRKKLFHIRAYDFGVQFSFKSKCITKRLCTHDYQELIQDASGEFGQQEQFLRYSDLKEFMDGALLADCSKQVALCWQMRASRAERRDRIVDIDALCV